jgi:hypothetical protein
LQVHDRDGDRVYVVGVVHGVACRRTLTLPTLTLPCVGTAAQGIRRAAPVHAYVNATSRRSLRSVSALLDAASPSLPRSPTKVTAETNVGVVYSGGIADSSGVADRARLLGTPDFAESPEPTCSIGGGLQSNDDFCDGPAETVIHHGPCRSDEGGLVQRSIEGNLRRKYKTWRWIDATLKAAMAAVEAGE